MASNNKKPLIVKWPDNIADPNRVHTSIFNNYFWDTPDVVGGGNIKVWTGSAFEAKPVKVWTGSAWEIKPLKRWTGSAWETTSY